MPFDVKTYNTKGKKHKENWRTQELLFLYCNKFIRVYLWTLKRGTWYDVMEHTVNDMAATNRVASRAKTFLAVFLNQTCWPSAKEL